MISFQKVTKSYKESIKPALENLSLHIEEGEFVFLVGSSGAGKSTLIKLISREQLPTTGKIFFQNRNTENYKAGELLQHRRSIGLIFQDYRLLKQKTVYENVAFALEVLGRSPKEIRKKVPIALEEVGLIDKTNVLPSTLSGGEQQRVGIARAIVKDPLLLLTDEPTGNLDRDNAWQLMELFEKINRRGTTIIIATHAWDIVNRMKKRVIALDGGILLRDEKHGSYDYEH